MSNWKECKLGDLAVTNRESVGKYFPHENILYLDTGSITCNKIDAFQEFKLNDAPSRAKRLVKEDDIIYSSVRPNQLHYGFMKNPPQNLVVSTGFVTITCDKNKINPLYLYYNLIQSQTTEFLHSIADASTSAYPSLKPSDLDLLDLLIPPLKEQAQIAEILSSLDDKIDLLHRQNKTLEQLAETLFRQWLNSNNAWVEKPLSTLIETTLGGEWGKDSPEGEFQMEVCCIRGTDIADLQIGIAERTPIRYVKEKKYKTIQPINGDLILEISGGTEDQSTGRTIYVDELNRTLFPHPIVFSNFCRLLRPMKEEYSYFLYLYIQYLYKNNEFFNLENGSSGIKNLDYKYLINELKFKLPVNENDILDFNESFSIYFEKINKNKHQILILTKLRDTLLPKLMNGEVRVNLKDVTTK